MKTDVAMAILRFIDIPEISGHVRFQATPLERLYETVLDKLEY